MLKGNPNAPEGPDPKLFPAVWWVIWAALLTSVFIYYVIFGHVFSSAKLIEVNSSLWVLIFVPLAVSTALRWLVLPGIRKAHLAFILFIAGMAVAESACLIGSLLFPEHRAEVALWSGLSVFQFIPFFARPYFKSDGQDRHS